MYLREYKEPKRNEPMTKLRVGCRPIAQALPDGANATAGISEVKVYASSVKKVVDDYLEKEPEKIEEAKKHFERGLTQYLAQMTADPEHAPEDVVKRARAQYPGSVEASFWELFGRDIKPLYEVKVLEENLVPPDVEQEIRMDEMRMAMLTPIIARSIKEAMERQEAQKPQQSQGQQNRR